MKSRTVRLNTKNKQGKNFTFKYTIYYSNERLSKETIRKFFDKLFPDGYTIGLAEPKEVTTLIMQKERKRVKKKTNVVHYEETTKIIFVD